MGRDRRIIYVRYMDDFVVLATTRWHLRKAIAQIHHITTDLKLRLHRKVIVAMTGLKIAVPIGVIGIITFLLRRIKSNRLKPRIN
ncbi:MAG: hypothetical protein QF414_03010 [Arenicellales bacterium]|jgi:nitrate reductase gamma subunit|nr:hypothetical protein [Arenicellales bacterium]|tara:strand:- start:6 stop:260 length:255 start_codon:yes stop_codon:yes gene_type:complete